MAVVALAIPSGQSASASTSSGAERNASTVDVTTAAHCPSGTAAGVTSSQINVATTIITVSYGSYSNATFGVPSSQEQEADWNLLAHNVNKSGGAGCRKIVLSFYDVNPLDVAGAQRVCLDIVAAHPYIVLDSGALTQIGASNCIPAHQIPLASEFLTQDQLTKYAPYDLLIGDLPIDAARNGTMGLKQLGYFGSSKGFKKLGFIYENCTPANVATQKAALAAAGVPTRKIVTYNLGCATSASAASAALEQAVLTFKNAGVTDVIEANVVNFGVFTQVAEQQNFRPRYLLDDGSIPTGVKSGANAPNPSNLNGAVDVVTDSYGEETTPGFKPSGGTEKCDAVFSAAAKPSVYKQADGYGGFACNYMWFLQALLGHAKDLQGTDLIRAMHSIGTLDLSYPLSPTNFSAAPTGHAYGVSYWRPVYYHSSCTCWQVPHPTWYPPFK